MPGVYRRTPRWRRLRKRWAATARGRITLEANAPGAVNASGGRADIQITADLRGQGDNASVGVADIRITADLQGKGTAASAGTAELLLTADLQGRGDAASTGTAELLLTADLQGHGDAASTGTADLRVTLDLQGRGDNANTGTAEALLTADVRGQGNNASAGTADITITADLRGQGTAATTGAADVTVTSGNVVALSGQGDNANTGTANLLLAASLQGHGDAASDAAATVTVTSGTADTCASFDDPTTGFDATTSFDCGGAGSAQDTHATRNRVLIINVRWHYPCRRKDTCTFVARARQHCPRGTATRISVNTTQHFTAAPSSQHRVAILNEADRLRDDLDALTAAFSALEP